jgi:hypothetical protein
MGRRLEKEEWEIVGGKNLGSDASDCLLKKKFKN